MWELTNPFLKLQYKCQIESCNGLKTPTYKSIRAIFDIKSEKSPSAPGISKIYRTFIFEIQGERTKKMKDKLSETSHRYKKIL